MNIPGIASKPLKIFLIVLSLLAVYSVIGFLLIPAVLKWKVPDIIQQETGRKALVKDIRFNPFLLSADIGSFELQETNGQPFVSFDKLDIDVNALQSIRHLALVIDKVRLDKPFVHLAKLKNGEFNFSSLLKSKPEEPKKEEGGLFPLTIVKLVLAEGKLLWEDAHFAEPAKEQIYPINLDIDNFTTRVDQQSRLGFSLALGSGGTLDWQGELGVNPVKSSGHIKLDNVNLQKIYELALQDKVPFTLKGTHLLDADYEVRYPDSGLELTISRSKIGVNDFHYAGKAPDNLTVQVPAFVLEGAYKVNYGDKTLQFTATGSKTEIRDIQLTGLNPDKVSLKIPTVTLESNVQADYAGDTLGLTTSDGKFAVKGFELSEKAQNKALVKVPSLAVQGIGVNLANQEVAVDSVAIDDVGIKAWLDKDGVINYQALFSGSAPQHEAETPATLPASPAEQAKAPWNIAVNNLALNNLGVEFEDQSLKKPVVVDIKPVNFKLTKFSTKNGAKLPFEFSAGVNKTGSIKLAGSTVIEPLQLQSAIDIKAIALDKFQPYFDKFAKLDVIDGKVNVHGDATVAMGKQDKLDVKFKGDSGIADLITRDRKLNKDLVKWKKLTVKDINVDLLSNRYTAAALVIDKPYARVTIRKDKTVNFADVMIDDKSKPVTPVKKPAKSAKAETKQAKPHFKLGKFQIIDGSSDFSDLSLILPFAAQIKSLDGGARGISSDQKSEINVELKGNAYDLSPVDIKGEISPYLGNYNVALNFQGLPMPLMSPYMAEFAGYKVEKGKLTLGLNYNVTDRKLTASNNILIDQFELGEKVDNPKAVSLPLGLAVALLKDSDGRIKIDVPITGSLEDPKFSMGGLIFDALLNVLTKIVTSPFNAIASLVGSQEDLSVVDFAAGKADLDQKQSSKLDGVAKALKEKPVLNLEIKGAAFQEQDWPVLQHDALKDQLKKLKADEVNRKGDKKTLAEYVELSEDDYKSLLADEFLKQFPTLAEKSFLGTPKLLDPKGGDFYQVAEQKLAAIIKPEPQRLKELAGERAQAIAKYIVEKGGIPNQRVFILDTALDPQRENTDIVSFLSLKTN